MNNDVELIDAKRLFSMALADMMEEMGINRDNYTDAEISHIVRSCVSEAYAACLDELVSWVLWGDDKREQTRAMIRLGKSRLRRK